ncbi:ABC-type branched-subunit amino acid transport system ATPase component [Bradyrhizobium sp. F1.13.1]
MSVLLEVKDLRSGYGRIPILFGIDMTVQAGEYLGILGHNGMGKTTTLRALMGHLPTTGGSVVLRRQDNYPSQAA